ncbi:MAG: oxygen-independent coproporphyrinogen-3 oxidase [Planctomycetota bacterium]|jgi:oxygen-independent coproporphyrinogen-3 oxidase
MPPDHTPPITREETAAKLKRFDRPGPRYTSYPTAVEFDEAVGLEHGLGRLAEADAHRDLPFSVYFHLPFCEERCLYCACHVVITPHKDRAAPYLDFLKGEMDLLAERLPNRRKVSQLHLGGGTPTYYTPEQLDDLLGHFFGHFEPAAKPEFAVEVDPRVTSLEHLDALSSHGFNRISFGVQDFTPEVQREIHRVQSVEQTAHLMEGARARGFGGINVDLIYGLPLQTLETFERSIETVIDMGADRAAVYSFAWVPWIRGHQRGIDRDKLPDRDLKFELFSMARERFLAAGYVAIGMDHFAKATDELALAKEDGRLWRNFQGYAVEPTDDVLGLGISSIGDVRGSMLQNTKKLSHYGRAIRAGNLPFERGILRTPEDLMHGAVIQELMCNGSVDVTAFEARHALRFAEYFARDLKELEGVAAEGLVEVTSERIRATPDGELFLRNIAICFDTHWREKHASSDRPIFSQTV